MKVQPPGTCCDRWQDRASIRPPMHQRSSFCAQEARRLDAARQRGRAEARGRRHGRSLGTLVEKSGWRLVWPEEGSSWPLRHVRASSDGSVGTGRGRAQSEEQPDASSLADNRPVPLHRQHSTSNLSSLCYGRGTLPENFSLRDITCKNQKLWLK